MTIDPEVWASIVHESGHLTIGSRLGLDARKVELVWEDSGMYGYSHIAEGSKLGDWLTTLLAGETAEVEVFGRHMLPRVHARSDRERLYLAVANAGRMGQQELFVAARKWFGWCAFIAGRYSNWLTACWYRWIAHRGRTSASKGMI